MNTMNSWTSCLRKGLNTYANSHASQLYNANIRESILKDITIPDFAEVCKHIPSQEHAQYTKNTLAKTKEQMLDIEPASQIANFGFKKDKLV
jgi:hypothetical protein